MTFERQQRKAAAFHELHGGGELLCLLNAWDAGSARVFAAEGCPAIGTTSAGVAFGLGRPDGERLGRGELLEATARIVAAVDVPVTADVESGYGVTPGDVAGTVGAVIAAGAVGVNLEDTAEGDPQVLRDVEDQCRHVRAARGAADDAGIRLFVNARTDVFGPGVDVDGDRLEIGIERLGAYVDAGADGVFAPWLTDPDGIARVADAVAAPLNVLASPVTPPAAELQRLGARRLSTGSGPMRATLALARRIARDLRQTGGYAAMTADAIPYDEANDLFA